VTDQQTTEISTESGVLKGPVRAPENRAMAQAREATGAPGRDPRINIHDDETAQKLGFKGGTIAGSIHMDQFVPVLLQAFGPSWFETGSLSLGFKNATISGEPVIAMVSVPPQATDIQVPVRMERPEGELVAEGTASVGRVDQPSYLFDTDLRAGSPDDLRIIAGVTPGQPLAENEQTLDPAGLKARIDAGALSEPLDWYTGSSPWGGPIATPSTMVQLLRNRPGDFGTGISEAVGLFGAIELRNHAGPVRFGVPYVVSGEVVAVGASPKTEYVWYDTRATDADGTVVASMRMQLRWMKASSPLYKES